jgi:transposase
MMVKGKDKATDQVEYVVMSDLVPEEHLLRQISRVLDFSFIYELVVDKYSPDKGRPGIDPVVLIKIVLIQFLFGIRSMRQTCKEIEVNAAYRWFLGMGWQDKTPHFTTFGKNYSRRFAGTDLFEQIFSHILAKCYAAGYVKGGEVFVDATHIKASANRNKRIKVAAKKDAAAYEQELLEEINKEREALGQDPFDDDGDGGGEVEITRSKTDPESGMFVKGEHERNFAYMAQTACNQHGFVLGYEVVPGNVHDSRSFWGLYEKIKKVDADHLMADAGFKTPAILRRLLLDDWIPVMPYTRPKTGDGLFTRQDYHYDTENDCYICPAGQVMRHTSINREGRRVYRSRAKQCKNCPNLSRCTNSKNHVKVIERHIWQDYVEQAEQIRKTPEGRGLYKRRKETIERVFADAKEKHGMRYTQLRGLAKVKMQVSLTFACLNLKKLATWGAKTPDPSGIKAFILSAFRLSLCFSFPNFKTAISAGS